MESKLEFGRDEVNYFEPSSSRPQIYFDLDFAGTFESGGANGRTVYYTVQVTNK